MIKTEQKALKILTSSMARGKPMPQAVRRFIRRSNKIEWAGWKTDAKNHGLYVQHREKLIEKVNNKSK